MYLGGSTRREQYRANRLTTAPAAEPLLIADLKAFLGISGTDDDTLLTDLIEQARQEIEDATGIAMITQTWTMTLDAWPPGREPWWDGVREGVISMLSQRGSSGSVMLPRYPLQSITSVTVYDEASNSTAVTVATVFDVDSQQIPGRITLKVGQTWPIALRANNAIQIVYVAGYGDASSDVPAPIIRAVRDMAAYMYEHRGECTAGDAYAKSGAEAIMRRYAVARI